MIGVIVNTAAVILGSILGLLCKKGIPKKVSDAIMKGIGLCTLYIGISGSLKGQNTLILILSMVFGIAVGTLLDIDEKITCLGSFVERKFSKADGTVSLSEGFVTASLLFCIGAMTIVGSLNAGLSGDNEMLFTKSVLDFVSSIMLSVSLGIGVLFSAVFILVFQGAIVLLAQFVAPVLTDAAIAEMTCAGSVMIIGLGLNILGLTKLKTANMLPALIFVPIICSIFSMLPFHIG